MGCGPTFSREQIGNESRYLFDCNGPGSQCQVVTSALVRYVAGPISRFVPAMTRVRPGASALLTHSFGNRGGSCYLEAADARSQSFGSRCGFVIYRSKKGI